jgi:hypothetical protein
MITFLHRLVLGSIAAIWMCNNCISQPVALVPGNATPNPSEKPMRAILSDTPSLLSVPNPWPWEKPQWPCALFRVSAAPSISSVDLYTSGLGWSLFAETATAPDKGCPNAGTWRDRIKLTKISATDSIDRFVAIKIDPKMLPTPGTSLEGTVDALVNDEKVAEFSLKVEHPPHEAGWTAITWVLTILIPALITFLVGQVGVKLANRQKLNADFRDYRLSNMDNVRGFLTEADTVIRSEQEHPGQLVYDFATKKNILSRMPPKGLHELYGSCARDDLPAVVRALKRLFPEVEPDIDKLERSLANKAH